MVNSKLLTLFEKMEIVNIKRTCNLIMITFANNSHEIWLHIECFFRVFNKNKTLICSEDIYKKGRKSKKRFKWDKPFSSLFDDCVEDNGTYILRIPISNVELKNNELYIYLANGVILEIIPNTVIDDEAYRIFTPEQDYLVV